MAERRRRRRGPDLLADYFGDEPPRGGCGSRDNRVDPPDARVVPPEPDRPFPLEPDLGGKGSRTEA
jgi:hypothetical protein